jgi:hypothetical protein
VNEQHTNYRDEQFWFTTAVVGFNTLIIAKDAPCFSHCGRIVASAVVSVLGAIIILTRWVAAAKTHADSIRRKSETDGKTLPPREGGRFKHFPAEAPNPEFASLRERIRYSYVEIRTGLRNFPYILTEASGSLFYLLLIGLSFVAVLLSLTRRCS